MANKKKAQSSAPVPLTRGQLSRAERERQRIRNLYTAAIALGMMLLLTRMLFGDHEERTTRGPEARSDREGGAR